ncbi:ABC transporter substrate-binding protein [Paenibacillus puerhi]|uniref:ABC transporter substrate-binding protein n=1 Tax=Paenibacillus puerhi TaxID=2692622 RepID=UPI0013587B7F|nr:iron-siderophore ABC transporter substrate-binding protein [Paenibacillus puerhi]
MLARMLGSYRNYWKPLVVMAVCLFIIAGCGATASKGETRSLQDAYGDVHIPVHPVRVVVLDVGALDNLLKLGIKPIGAPSILAPGEPYPAYLKGTEDIENIGSVNEPNLETIDRLKPDLIIGNKDTHDQIHKQLSQIAPTVFVETLGVTWKANLLIHAEAVGKASEGKRLLDEYDTRIKELKTKLGDQPKSPEVSVIRTRKDKVQIYLNETFSGVILADAGIKRPSAQSGKGFSKDLTDEQIAEADGDFIFWFTRDKGSFERLQSIPLWAPLKAVRQNKVQQVDWETWMSGLGIQAVHKVVDDLYQYLVK